MSRLHPLRLAALAAFCPCAVHRRLLLCVLLGVGLLAGPQAATAAVPAAPTGLTATPGDQQITFSWDDPSDASITHYEIGTNFANLSEISGSSATTTSHTVTGLTNDTSYNYILRAVNDDGNGPVAGFPQAVPLPPPAKPVGFTAEGVFGGGQVLLEWLPPNPSDASITKWQYKYSVTGGAGADWMDIPGEDNTLSYLVKNLTNDKIHTFTLRAVNAIGNGASSDPVSAVPEEIPYKVKGLTATATNGQVTLNWPRTLHANVTGWEYQINNGSWETISGATNSTTSHTITDLTNDIQYKFSIRVAVSGSTRIYPSSDSVLATPISKPAKPALAATAGDGEARLHWPNLGDRNVIRWEYKQDNGSWTQIQGANENTIKHTVTGLTNGTEYTFKVRAWNKNEAGHESDAVTVTPTEPPGKPSGLTAASGEQSVTLTWTALGNPTVTGWQYEQTSGSQRRVWRDMKASSAATTSHTVINLINGVAYTFRIRAVNTSGDGAASDPATAIVGAPTVASILRQNPTARKTSADRLTWRVTFNKAVRNVDGADFTLTGTTATASVSTVSNTVYDVTASGGDLAGLNAVVTLSFATGNNIEDLDDNALDTTKPTGAEDDFEVGNVPPKPSGLTAASGEQSVTLTWSALGDATVTRWQYEQSSGGQTGAWQDISPSSAATTSHTVTGLTNGTAYSFRVRAVNPVGDGAASDPAAATPGNPNVVSITRQSPATRTTSADRLTWRVTFSRAVRNVTSADFTLTGTTASPSVSAVSGSVYDVTASGGDLPGLNAVVTLGFASGQNIEDLDGNALDPAKPAGTQDDFVVENVSDDPDDPIDPGGGDDGDDSDDVFPPGAPRNLTATPGHTTVSLSWSAPAQDGGSAVTGYAVRHGGSFSAWSDVPGGAGALRHTVDGLEQGTAYTFEVRASNDVGNGPAASVEATTLLDLAPVFNGAAIPPQVYTQYQAIPPLRLPAASGGDGALTYALTPAAPAGLTFDPATRTLSGAPTVPMAVTEYALTATDQDGDSVSLTFTIEVRESMALGFGGALIPDQFYLQNEAIEPLTLPAASGGDGVPTYALTPAAPAGLAFDPATRTLSGAPTELMAATAYTWTATDQDGDSASLTFTIAVVREDLVPSFGGATVPDQSYLQNEAIEPLTLPMATGGDGALTYALTPAAPAGLAFDPATRTLSGAPTEDFPATVFTYTATDADGDAARLTFRLEALDLPPTFAASVSDQRYRQNRAIDLLTLPAATGGDGELTYSLSPAAPAGLTFDPATRSLSGTPSAAQAPRSFTYTATDADGDAANLTFSIEVLIADFTDEAARLILPEMARALADQAVGAVSRRMERAFSGGSRTSSAVPDAATAAGWLSSLDDAGDLDFGRLLGGRAFSLASQPSGSGGGAFTLWGSGDYRSLDRDDGLPSWDGELASAHLGMDLRVGNVTLAGVAGSRHTGSAGWGTGSGDEFHVDLVRVMPYLGFSLGIGELWTAAGGGTGSIERRDLDSGVSLSGDLVTRTAGGGASVGRGALRLKGEALWTSLEVDDASYGGRGLEITAHRARMMVQFGRSGGALRPSLEAGGRYDGGDGETGLGAELGASVAYVSPSSRLSISGSARALLDRDELNEWIAHRVIELSEWGAQGMIRLNPGTRDTGLSLSFAPGYGPATSGLETLWRHGLRRGSPGYGVQGNRTDMSGRMSASAGYGLPVSGGRGVLMPFAEADVDTYGRSYRVGLNWRVASGGAMRLSLERTERGEAASAMSRDHGVFVTFNFGRAGNHYGRAGNRIGRAGRAAPYPRHP